MEGRSKYLLNINLKDLLLLLEECFSDIIHFFRLVDISDHIDPFGE